MPMHTESVRQGDILQGYAMLRVLMLSLAGAVTAAIAVAALV